MQSHMELLPLLPSAHAAMKAEAFPPHDSANPASCHRGLHRPSAKRLAPLPGLVPGAAVNTSLPQYWSGLVCGRRAQHSRGSDSIYSK